MIYVFVVLCTHGNSRVLCYFQKNEISKMGFVRHMKAIVGDHMLKMAVCKVQVQVSMKWLFKPLRPCLVAVFFFFFSNIPCVVLLF